MKPVKKLLVSTIQQELLPFGFQKDGSIWYKKNGEILSMLSLRQSSYGAPVFYLEVGIYVKSIADANTQLTKMGIPAPAIGSWQAIGRLNDYYDDLNAALNGETQLTGERRQQIVRSAIDAVVLPILASLETKEGIRNQLARSNFMAATVSLRRWLNSQ